MKPNVLFILTDQLRGDCVGAGGNGKIMTPVIDGLANEGIRFANCYSTCPVCVPARRSILSGQFPETHGADYNAGDEWNPEATLPQCMGKDGYHTYFAGRDMHQYTEKKRFGFDHYLTTREYTHWVRNKISSEDVCADHWLDGLHYTNGPMHNSWTARPWIYEEDLHPTNWTVNEGVRFLNRLRDPSCPYFLMLSFLAPHPPLVPPAFYYDRYMRIDDAFAPSIGEWETKPGYAAGAHPSSGEVNLGGEYLRSCIAGYYGSINHIDDQLHRIVNELMPDMNDTIIVFTSDHGEMLGDHYMWRKSRPYEGAAHVPLIIKFPEHMGFRRGLVIDAPVCLEDIMPTLLDACGMDIPSCVEGRSLVPLVREQSADWREFVHIRHGSVGAEGFHALTDGRRKYIRFHERESESEQYFDLEADRGEKRNLIEDSIYQNEISAWRKRLDDELTHGSKGSGLRANPRK